MPDKRQLKEKANSLPLLPGVYIMKNASGEIIYIGKAVKLKNRVTQYFGAGTAHTLKVKKMVDNVADFEYIICDNEFEALTLENSLIKRHTPKYNILLKDDKGYHYVRVSNDKWRRIEAVKNNKGKGVFIGPYNSASVVKQTVSQAQKIYKLPNCTRNFDKKTKPCLNYHIGLCMAPCKADITLAEYNEAVDSAVRFIKNSSAAADEINALSKQMELAAEQLNFEYAAKLRDRINAIKRIAEKQKVISNLKFRIDVFATALVGDNACVQVFKFKGGHLADKEYFYFSEISDRQSFYNEFLPRYYADNEDVPREILTDCQSSDYPLIEGWLALSGKKVTITVPQRGDRRHLVNMCLSNAAEQLSKKVERSLKETSALNELAGLLGMANPPRYIESYDISNTAGEENVAGMIVFKDGRPFKQNYRKFKIKSFIGQDDYRSMAEVIERRFSEYEKETDQAFSVMPDLILLDGGAGQLSVVTAKLKEMGIDVAVYGMVKDSKHQTNAIVSDAGKITIKQNRSAYTLVTNIQNEVHRFAIGYHKSRRTKAMFNSELTKIQGVGLTRAAALLKHFKTMKALRNATPKEISKVKGISYPLAEKIYNALKEN